MPANLLGRTILRPRRAKAVYFDVVMGVLFVIRVTQVLVEEVLEGEQEMSQCNSHGACQQTQSFYNYGGYVLVC